MSEQPLKPSPEQQDEQWEQTVRENARHFAYPPTPNIAGSVRGRLSARRAVKPVRGLRWAVAVLLVALAVALAVPGVRAALLEVIRIGTVNIFFQPPTATVTPTDTPFPKGTNTPTRPLFVRPTPRPTVTPLASVLDLPGATTLEDARTRFAYSIRLPAYPPDLGEPDRVFRQQYDGLIVTLVWLEADDPTAVRLSLHMLDARSEGSKYYPWEGNVVTTSVNGHRAEWLTDVHLLYFYRTAEEYARVVDSNVLIWSENGLTYRLEIDADLDEARRIAESLE